MYPQGTIRHSLGLGLLVAFVLLALSACGGGAGAEQRQATARPLPESGQDLSPGEYRTEVFEPALSVAVGKGWALECPEGHDFVCLFPPGGQTRLRFVNVDEVYEPSELVDMSGKTTQPPAALVGWLGPYCSRAEWLLGCKGFD